MNTVFLLLAQYDSRAIIPLGLVCRDYFPHLTPEKILRKQLAGEIELPVVRIDPTSRAVNHVCCHRLPMKRIAIPERSYRR